MSGVTHFERRDRQKRIHAECSFCGKKIKGTPMKLAGVKGDEWLENWLKHVVDELEPLSEMRGPTEAALRTAMSVAREFDRNR